MKSPLVDALRLAGGQDKAANNEQAQPAADAEVPVSEAVPAEPLPTLLDSQDGPELSLMDATDVLVVQSTDETDDEFATSQVIAEEAVNEAIHGAVEKSDDDLPAPPPVAAEPTATLGVSQRGRRAGLVRFGMFSPLICLLLASAAMGSYFLYQSAGGALRDTGIGMPTPVPGTGNNADAAGDAAGPINRFPLIADGRQSRASQPQSRKPRAIAPSAILRGNNGSVATEPEIKEMLQQHPGSAHLHFALGTVMAQQGRWADARLAYYRALAIEPQHAEYQFNLAVSLEKLGQYDDARARYEAALANVSAASTIDSQLVATRIAVLAESSVKPGAVQ